jgi:hypothetical protein
MRHTRKLVAPIIAAIALLVSTPTANASVDTGAGTRMYIDCNSSRAEFNDNGVRIRRQPNTSSAINGLGYDGQDAWVHRVVSGQPVNGYRGWADLTNLVTGVRGYVSIVYIDCRP